MPEVCWLFGMPVVSAETFGSFCAPSARVFFGGGALTSVLPGVLPSLEFLGFAVEKHTFEFMIRP